MLFKKTVLAVMLSVPFILNAADFPSSAANAETSQQASAINETQAQTFQKVNDDAIRTASSKEAQAETLQQTGAKTASDLADKFIELLGQKFNYLEGWNPEGEVYIAKAVATFSAKNVKKEDLLAVRAMKFNEASLDAKAQIIRFIRDELSAENKVELPENALESQIDIQIKKLTLEIEEKTKAYKEALKNMAQAKDDAFGDVNKQDIIRETVSALINKIGGSINIDNLKKEQRDRLEKRQQEIISLKQELDNLKEEAEKAKQSVKQTNTSLVESLAHSVICGAMVVNQYESLTPDGMYEVAVIVTWSPKQERLMNDMFNQIPTNLEVTGKQSLSDYIRSNDWSSAIGGRKFLDNKGDLHLLGIGAAPIRDNSSAGRRAAEVSARAQANSQIALAFLGDTKVKEAAASKIQEVAQSGADPKTINTESMSQVMEESVHGIHLQGVSKRFSKVYIHPLLGEKVLVYISDMSLKNSAAAKMIERMNYQDAIDKVKQNQISAGEKAGMESALTNQIKDSSSFQKGFSSGVKNATETKAVRTNVPQTQAPAVQVQETERPAQTQGIRSGAAGGSGVSTDALLF